jgi:hypothetical protein
VIAGGRAQLKGSLEEPLWYSGGSIPRIGVGEVVRDEVTQTSS